MQSSDGETPPEAPRLESADLPTAEGQETLPTYTGPGFVTNNPELASLTPAQLYELNQGLLDEAVPQRPLIDQIVPMAVLRAEYENGSASFTKQIDYLVSQSYTGIRRTRGDGDCFYRSLAFRYVERLMNAADPALAVGSAVSTLEASLPMLEAAGFQKLVFEDFYDTFVSIIKRIVQPEADGTTLTPLLLLEAFQNPEVSNSVVVYLRLLTSAQIRTDPDSYQDFLFHPELGELMTPREFCETFVEAVGKEADHVQMTALARALKINFSVAYLDGRSADGHVDFVNFNDGIQDELEPLVLLYRPGHYDILEKQSEDTVI
ncbi:cysteine proteinase [Gloeophyllum trabeum ATCC 11539]|uniref:ubiquitinyl hydrolase 1 n=1 Tax=Gloeophyllum trabeum (strain ATCC 11539 / FP-39264 / Madison 617) TaxID=670483 RepID=S7Q8H1_GLOTA|nr:cysteine proteinase [Gloeophyllum trabeum ATCC 11539]EPQ55743.1 cysteine proteinase [Gloeophyllum trabeum ATCC 11539]